METAALVAVALVAAGSLIQAGALLVMLRSGSRAAQRVEDLVDVFTRHGGAETLRRLEATSRDLAEATHVARRAVERSIGASIQVRTNGLATASTFRRNMERVAPLVAVVALIRGWRVSRRG